MSAAPGSVSAHVLGRLTELLDGRGAVVWYDGELAFGGLLDVATPQLESRGVAVVSAAGSRLQARRAADEAWSRLGGPGGRRALLLYVPEPRGEDERARQADPFEPFARVGDAFGDGEGERLRALATAALPGQAAALERLFADGALPPLATLDALSGSQGARSPLLRKALDTEDLQEALARALSQPDAEERLAAVPGALGELASIAEGALGLPPIPGESLSALRQRLAGFVLLGELARELPKGIPPALAGVPCPAGSAQELAASVVERLRGSDDGREALAAFAAEVETRYGLTSALGADPPLTRRDTFPLQDHARVRAVVRLAGDDLPAARKAVAGAARSIWRRREERVRLWAAVERCLEFLETAETCTSALNEAPRVTRGMFERYAAPEGLWRIDAAQRRFEQALADCAHDEEVEFLAARCRARYRELIDPLQSTFQSAVRKEGWPPDGIRRQTRTFDDRVAPALAEGARIVYLLVDSLRFEMGRELAGALESLGTVEVEATAAALPTITPNGMAALLPGADGALRLLRHGEGLVPAIGETLLPGLADRQALLRARLGDRVRDTSLPEVLQAQPKRLAERFAGADLLVVRSLTVDDEGEGRSAFEARRAMGAIFRDVKTAIERLIAAGFGRFVIAADHGHMLLPDLPAGESIPAPAGEWLLRKRRMLMGAHRGATPGALVLQAATVGIASDVPGLEYVATDGFKAFQSNAFYFHEGLSLQECVVPVLALHAAALTTSVGGGEQVTITYRAPEFRGGVVGLKVLLTAMLTPSVVVRIEAFDGAGPKATRVGEASDCDALDPVTGEVTLQAGIETQVPLSVDFDFAGPSIEVRATDPKTGVIHATLQLKNGRSI